MLQIFKDLSVGGKLVIGFGSLLLAIVVLSFLSYRGVQNLVHHARQASLSDRLKNAASEIEIAHLVWVAQVRNVFTEADLRKLDVQTDPTQCRLGQWFRSQERSAAEAAIPKLKEVFATIDEPHRRLHQSAVRINEILPGGRYSAFTVRAMEYWSGGVMEIGTG
jgi:methyl-accepting chemotaxis protein